LAPCGAAGQEGKTAAEAADHEHTITVTPSERGCAVALSAKVGKARGTPAGLDDPTLGEAGRDMLSSVISCLCGGQAASQVCPRGGTCMCRAPGETPAVVCN
jgi:hypothetical protein